jgi:hypothetical protein
MNSRETTSGDPFPVRHPPKAIGFVLALLLFMLAGPPLGGLVAWMVMGARNLNSPIPFLTGSYAEAAILAFCVGLLVSGALLAGYRSAAVPLAAALLVNLLTFALTGALSIYAFEAGALLRVAYVFIPPSLVATFVCWALSRRYFLP